MRHSILAIILWVVPVSSSAQVPVDARFVLETVASGAGAVCLEIDAAGVLYVCEKRGRLLRLVPNGSGGYAAPVVVLDIRGEVDAGVEGGLLGLALAPDFATSRQLYALFTTASDQRIERWTLDAARTAVQAGGRSVVLSGLPRATAEHKAGHIAFRPGDATHLYVSLGDDAAPALAQNLDAYNGKILRIRAASGQGETDNPHYDGNLGSVRSRVFARGMRNPFRFVFHPTEHALYVSENGDDTDRISRVRPGSNGSWSAAGDSADYLNPPDTNFRVMQTIPPRSSLVGLHVVSGGPFGDPGGGAGYTLWVANAFNEAGRGIRRFAVSGAALDTLTALDGGGSFVLPSGFSFGAEIELGPDGALYMTQAGVDEADGPGFATVSRLRFAGGDAPVASFTASPDPEAGGLVPFSLALADTSTDEDGTIASRMWTFGDGATSTAASPTHVYTHAGTYTLTLRVVDDDGLVGMRSVSVRVRVSATVRFMLTVRDGDTREGGPLSASTTLDLLDPSTMTPIDVPGGALVIPSNGMLDVTRTLVVPGDVLVGVLAAGSSGPFAERRFAVELDTSVAMNTFTRTLFLARTAITGRAVSTRGLGAVVDVGVRSAESPYAFAGGRDYLAGGPSREGALFRTDTDALGFYYVPIVQGDAGAFSLDFVGDTGVDIYHPRIEDVTITTGARVERDVVLGLVEGGESCRELTAPTTRRVDFTTEIVPIFARCVGCHGASATGNGDLDLATDPFAALVSAPSAQVPGAYLVVPGESDASYLMEKVRCSAPQVGATMPLVGMLTDEELGLLRDWIDQGARAEPRSGGCDVAPVGAGGPFFAILVALLTLASRSRARGAGRRR